MAWTEAQVPLLDPATDKFPDRFAPPSVAADKLAAAVSAAAALASEQTATTQAETATTQAGIATTQAGIATTQAGIATTQAETAATQAGISTTQAETATTQAGLAQTAARAASLSAGAADTSADTAATQAGIATTQAGIATTQAGIAATQAGIATTKAGEASTSAGTATTKAGEAATSAAAALVSEQNAAATLANAVTKTTYDARGDLLVGTGADAYTRLPVGANGTIPVADSAAGTGVKWSTADAANIVDKTSAQTVTGVKTMTAPAFVAAVPAATFGADLTPAGGLGDASWTLAGGASWAAPNLTIPSGGSASCTVAGIVSGKTYQIDVTRSASSGGDMTVSIGAASISVPSWSNNRVTVVALASGSLTLTVGGGTWAATVQSVVVREVTATAGPVLAYGAGQIRQSGSYNNAVGQDAQRSLTTGSNNSALGASAQYSLTTGAYNNAVGQDAQYSLTTGAGNNAMGYAAQYSLTTGSNNSALGHFAQYSLTTGSNNSALGYFAQYSLTTGGNNSALGYFAQRSLTTGSNNSALGYSAQRSLTTGAYNNAVGRDAQYSLTTGAGNNAMGTSAQYSLTTGSNNSALGHFAQYSLTTGSNNSALGYFAQYSLTTGAGNNAMGQDAQYRPRGNSAWATTTAYRQTTVGHESGQGSATPSDDIVTIGYRAIADGTKAMALGSMASAAHAGSVALGADVTTTALAQVHIGPRHLAMSSVTAPTAPPASGGRLFVQVTGGKSQLAVIFPTGAIQVLATEP